MQIVGLIPARAGSKGIPGKNTRLLANKPLIAYTIECALESKVLGQVVVSTEDPKTAEIASSFGAEVPFLRPVHLAQDETPTLPVVQHALQYLEQAGTRIDAICLLQPTSPFRSVGLLREAVEIFQRSEYDSLVTLKAVPAEYHPEWVLSRDKVGQVHWFNGQSAPISRRQDLSTVYIRDGSIYITRRDCLLSGSLYGDRIYGLVNHDPCHVNLDHPEDWATAERILLGS